jgi:hypothetical protein
MNWESWMNVVRATDAAYAAGNDAQKQAAVAQREQAAAQHQNYLANYRPPPNFAPSGGGGGAPAPYFPAAPPPPKPPVWLTQETYTPKPGIKQADPDTILFNDDAISPEFLVELGYEDISGMELINISRSDIIDGQNVIYSPVKQLTSLRERYNPNNIISLPELFSSFFSRFQIDLLLRGISKPYFDGDGNLVIEIDTIFDNEIVDIEIDTSGTINIIEFPNEEDVVS